MLFGPGQKALIGAMLAVPGDASQWDLVDAAGLCIRGATSTCTPVRAPKNIEIKVEGTKHLVSVNPPAWPDPGPFAIIKILLTSVVVDLLREIPSWAAAQAFANRRTTPCTTPPTPWPPGFTSTARRL